MRTPHSTTVALMMLVVIMLSTLQSVKLTVPVLLPNADAAEPWYAETVGDFQQRGFIRSDAPYEAAEPAMRAELVWIIGQMRGGWSEGIINMPTFDDVIAENPYAPAFEKGVVDGWIRGARNCAGTHPCFAKPWERLNRAEAATLIIRAFIIVQTESSPDMSDVPAGQWYEDAMRTAASVCILQGDDTEKTFRPGDTMNRAEMLTMLQRAEQKLSYERDCAQPDTSPTTSSSSSSSAITNDPYRIDPAFASASSSSDTGPDPIVEAPQESDLLVSLNPFQPVRDIVPKGALGIHAFSMDFSASCRKPVQIDAITLARSGAGPSSDILGVWLRGDGRRLSRVQPFESSQGTSLIRLFETLIIPPCETVTIDALIDLRVGALADARHRVSLDYPEDIETDATIIEGNFPFESETYRVDTKPTGLIKISYLPVPQDVEEDEIKAVISKFRLKLDDIEDQTFYTMQMENRGTSQDGDFVNMFIRTGGTRLTQYEPQTVADYVTFSFEPPEPVEALETFDYEVVADIVAGRNRDIRMEFREPSDVFAIGSVLGRGDNAQLYGSRVQVDGRPDRVDIRASSTTETDASILR